MFLNINFGNLEDGKALIKIFALLENTKFYKPTDPITIDSNQVTSIYDSIELKTHIQSVKKEAR